MRLGPTDGVRPVDEWPSIAILARNNRSLYPLLIVPTNRAVLVPERLDAAYPASSIAFHTYIIRSRCCGSIRSASAFEIPKNRGSNRSTPSITPAHLTFVLLAWVFGSPKYASQ